MLQEMSCCGVQHGALERHRSAASPNGAVLRPATTWWWQRQEPWPFFHDCCGMRQARCHAMTTSWYNLQSARAWFSAPWRCARGASWRNVLRRFVFYELDRTLCRTYSYTWRCAVSGAGHVVLYQQGASMSTFPRMSCALYRLP